MTTQQTNTQQPVETLRDGPLKVTIWKNQGDNGPYFAVKAPIRSFRDDAGNWKETSSLSGSQVLRAAHLLAKAYDRVIEVNQSIKEQAQAA